MPDKDWSPETYSRFRGLRLRPALDLLAQVPELPPGDIVDLCCGNGAVGADLALRWPDRKLVGVDTSPAMLAEAKATGLYARLDQADAALWAPHEPAALIFSNAALHWLPDHAALFARLAGQLARGGTLAVQMPRQTGAPSHRFLRDFAADLFPDRFDLASWKPPVAAPVEYHRMLAPLGRVNVWETDYVQRLDPADGVHPVRRFTEGAAMRPFVAQMSEAEAAIFTHRYDEALVSAYPVEADGSVLLPFRRLFFTLTI